MMEVKYETAITDPIALFAGHLLCLRASTIISVDVCRICQKECGYARYARSLFVPAAPTTFSPSAGLQDTCRTRADGMLESEPNSVIVSGTTLIREGWTMVYPWEEEVYMRKIWREALKQVGIDRV